MPHSLTLVADAAPRVAVATIVLSGVVARSAAARARRAIRAIPNGTRAAHLDLTHVRLYDVAAMNAAGYPPCRWWRNYTLPGWWRPR